MTIAAGSRLGPYEILAPLGAGGMGEVYRARDERLSREVAIKVLPASVASDGERLRRFEKEARSASALNHPNIVTIYDIESTEGVSWIAMEKVEGATLRELLTNGALPVKRLLQIAAQIAEGLAKAHESGIVHRDLKPENVMVTKSGLVKVLDFGLAKLTSTMSGSGEGSALPTMTGTTPGVVVGTVGYMSPEQASGEALDFRSDQFSFGSILYEMATGKRAFQKKMAIDTLGAILNLEPEPIGAINPLVPAPLRWIAERCLSKEPEGRYGTTGDLARDLATIRERLSEASATSEVAAPARKRTTFVPAAVGVAALALGLLAGKLLWKASPPSFPRFKQLTFGDATVVSARFAPDGQTVVYGITREFKPFELLSTRVDSPESRPLGLNADIQSMSSSGEMAILIGGPRLPATLAEVPLAGGAPRELLERVMFADWSPDGKGLAVVVASGGPDTRLEYPVGRVLLEKKGFLFRPRFSPRGDGILVSNPDSLLLVNAETGKHKEVFQGGTTGYGWSTSSDQIWVMSETGATTEVHALKVGGPARLIATLPGKFLMHDVGKDERILAERILGRTQMKGKAWGETRERDLSWLNDSFPADISPDGQTVLFNEGGGEARAGVYLRRMDGSPAVRLGDGGPLALSPDGKWALCRRGDETILQPTGAGLPRVLKAAGIEFDDGGTFYPDGKRVLLAGKTADDKHRLYRVTLDGGEAQPVTPAGVFLPFGWHAISPDGRLVAAVNREAGTWSLYPIEEGASISNPLSGRKEEVICWSSDKPSLWVRSTTDGSLVRVDLATGRRELVKEFPGSSALWVTPDGRGYVYEIGQTLSNLWLIDGLKP
jgi:eukaryotic-like serine/threonine-protein kinase